MEIARQRRGLTKKALAEAVGLTSTSLQHYAASRRVPELDTVSRLAAALDFPKGFFYGPDLDLPPANGTSYRALSRATARDRMQASAIGAIGLLFSDWIEMQFSLPAVDVPEHDMADPEVAAEAVRFQWGLGALSIRNSVALLEDHGMRVFALATDTPALDAFSFWHGLTPYVFLNTSKSAERTRMDVAHELGHLVLHRNVGASLNRQAEQEAKQFAGAFLMPRDSVAAHLPLADLTSLDEFRESKRQWNVSLTSLLYRTRELGYLTEYRYRGLIASAGQRGYLRNEPDGCKPDTSVVLERLFSPFREDSEDPYAVAKAINVQPAEVYSLMRGLLPFPMPVL